MVKTPWKSNPAKAFPKRYKNNKSARLISKNADPFRSNRGRRRPSFKRRGYTNRPAWLQLLPREALKRRSIYPRRKSLALSLYRLPRKNKASRKLKRPGDFRNSPYYRRWPRKPRHRRRLPAFLAQQFLPRGMQRLLVARKRPRRFHQRYFRKPANMRPAGRYRYRAHLTNAQVGVQLAAIGSGRRTTLSAGSIARRRSIRRLLPKLKKRARKGLKRKIMVVEEVGSKSGRKNKSKSKGKRGSKTLSKRRLVIKLRRVKKLNPVWVARRRYLYAQAKLHPSPRIRPLPSVRRVPSIKLHAISARYTKLRPLRAVFPKLRRRVEPHWASGHLVKEWRRFKKRRRYRKLLPLRPSQLTVARQLLRKIRALNPATRRFLRRFARKKARRRGYSRARKARLTLTGRKRRRTRAVRRGKVRRYRRGTPALLRAVRERFNSQRALFRHLRVINSSYSVLQHILPSAAKRSMKSALVALGAYRAAAARRLLKLKYRLLAKKSSARPTPAKTKVTYQLSAQTKRSHLLQAAASAAKEERNFYRSRPKLRLPQLPVTRKEREQLDPQILARLTLKRPETVAGKGKLLLPPLSSTYITTVQRGLEARRPVLERTLTLPTLMGDKHPRVWNPRHKKYLERLLLAKVKQGLFEHFSQQAINGHLKVQKRLQPTRVVRALAVRRARKFIRGGRLHRLHLRKMHQVRKFRRFVTDYIRARRAYTRRQRKAARKTVLRTVAKSKHSGGKLIVLNEKIAQRLAKVKGLLGSALPTVRTEVSKTVLLGLEETLAEISALLNSQANQSSATKSRALPKARSEIATFKLQKVRHTNTELRHKALWHLRSVTGMLNQERSLSAWSPQFSPSERRHSYPRVFNWRVPTRRLSRTGKDARRVANKRRARRKLPARRYPDFTFDQLQYYHGSAASMAHLRYRRAYRPKSKGNRWWAPINQPVPFTHPYSRRSLNAKKLSPLALHSLRGQRASAALSNKPQLCRVIQRKAKPFEVPSRLVRISLKPRPNEMETESERNAHREKREAMRKKREAKLKKRYADTRARFPTKLHIWQGTRKQSVQKVAVPCAVDVALLPRTRRSIRRLEQTCPKYNVWAKNRWTALDPESSPQSVVELYYNVMRRVKEHLPRGDQRSAQELHRRLLLRLRSWSAHTPLASSAIAREQGATAFLLAELGAPQHSSGRMYNLLEGTEQKRRISSKQDRFWALRSGVPQGKSIYRKKNFLLRRRWLHGAERYLKRNQVGRLPPRHRRGGDHRMVNYGRIRRRFPASGRARHTYESILHVFVKKTAPANLRRVNTLRFPRLRPRIYTASKTTKQRYKLTRLRRLQRRIAQRLSRIAYLSRTWRELLNRRTATSVVTPTPFGGVVKRRFNSLPINLIFKRKRAEHRAARSAALLPLRTHRARLLRIALLRRRMLRAPSNLRKHLYHRRLPRETGRRYIPRHRRREETRYEFFRYGVWNATPSNRNRAWSLRWLGGWGTARTHRPRVVALTNATGDSIVPAPQLARRVSWAVRGFDTMAQGWAPLQSKRRSRRRPWFEHRAERRRYHRKTQRFNGATKGRFTRLRKKAARLHPSWAGAELKTPFRRKVFFSARRRAVPFSPVRTTLRQPSSDWLNRSNQLRRRVISGKHKFARRLAGAYRRLTPRLLKENSLLVESSATPYSRKLADLASSPLPLISPLMFLNRTRLHIKSAAERLRAVVWKIENRRKRYRRTAQYTESLTKFIPALMSYMMSRHISSKKLNFRYVKGLISATYWNLRIHLNVDPFERRLHLRDRSYAALRFLTKAVGKLVKGQITEHPQRTKLRWRFQPFRMQYAPNTQRHRLDWLRAFFPRLHAFYQEDAERFARTEVAIRLIRRIPLTGYGVARARTYPATTNVEKRARQLFFMRLSRRDLRLETVLQTTRRVSEEEEDLFVPALIPEKELSLEEKEAARVAKELREDAEDYARSKKFVFVKKGRKPKYTAAELAEQAAYAVFDTHPAVSVGIPGRNSFFARSFSTFAGQALVGVSKLVALQHRLSTPEGASFAPFQTVVARARIKARLVARGRTDFISSPRMINAGGLDPRFQRYKSPRSRQYQLRLTRGGPAQNISALLTAFEQKRTALLAPTKRGLSLTDQKAVSEADQVARLRRRFYRPELPSSALPAVDALLQSVRTFVANRRIAVSLRGRRVKPLQQVSLTHREYATKWRKSYFLPIARRVTRVRAFVPPSARVVKGGRSVLRYRLPAARSLPYRLRRPLVVGYRAVTPHYWVGRRNSTAYRKARSLRKHLTTKSKLPGSGGVGAPFNRSIRSSGLFIPSSFVPIARRARFTRRALLNQRVSYQTPFDSYRPTLWHMTTHRWMKKFRIVKEWLKITKLWLREPWVHSIVDANRPPSPLQKVYAVALPLLREYNKSQMEYAAARAAAKKAKKKFTKKDAAPFLAIRKSHLPRLLKFKRRIRFLLRREPKARPPLRVANEQCRRWVAKKEEWIKKPKAEKYAYLMEKKRESIESVRAGKGPIWEPYPLKLPANHFIPTVIWKDIHRRVRRLPWRESDEEFFRPGFRNAFRFFPSERNRAPWLEAMMLTRSLYSTKLHEFRRRQFPREQKKYKWLQRVRKSFFPGRENKYINGRRWARLRIYNQKLHYSLFSIPDRNAARRHFRKRMRRSDAGGFTHMQIGTANRLDNILMNLNMAPTIFVARIVATRGLLKVNGKVAYGADFQLNAGDYIEPVWEKVVTYRQFFKNYVTNVNESMTHRWSRTGVPANLEYHHRLGTYTYHGPATEDDLRVSTRLSPHLFRWFYLDSGAKKSVT